MEGACQTAGRAVAREHAQQAVDRAGDLNQQLLAHRARAGRLAAELREHEGAAGVHLQPEFTSGVPRAYRSELLRREVEGAIRRADAQVRQYKERLARLPEA